MYKKEILLEEIWETRRSLLTIATAIKMTEFKETLKIEIKRLEDLINQYNEMYDDTMKEKILKELENEL